MFPRTANKIGAIGAYVAMMLCCILVFSSVLAAPSVAKAAGQKEQIDKLIQDWKNRYGSSSNWRLVESSESEKLNAIQNGLVYHALPQEGHISQTKALRYAIEAVLRVYDLSPSALTPYWPHFFFLVEDGEPYWQITFMLDSKVHTVLEPITVGIQAVSGKVRFITQGSKG